MATEDITKCTYFAQPKIVMVLLQHCKAKYRVCVAWLHCFGFRVQASSMVFTFDTSKASCRVWGEGQQQLLLTACSTLPCAGFTQPQSRPARTTQLSVNVICSIRLRQRHYAESPNRPTPLLCSIQCQSSSKLHGTISGMPYHLTRWLLQGLQDSLDGVRCSSP